MDNLMIIIKDKKELFDVLNEWEASKVSIKKNEIKDPEEIYFTQREAARFLRITLPTLIAWKKSRKIPFYQHGRKVLFKKSEILETMKNSVI
jgi:excisionase family DNA binding protein